MSDSDRIAALEAAVATLRAEVLTARRPRLRSMRDTGRCTSCGGGYLLHFRRIKDVAHGSTHDLSLQKDYSRYWGVKLTAGTLEAYACRSCRLVEWHASTLDDIQPDGEDVVEMVAPDETPVSDTPPYR